MAHACWDCGMECDCDGDDTGGMPCPDDCICDHGASMGWDESGDAMPVDDEADPETAKGDASSPPGAKEKETSES